MTEPKLNVKNCPICGEDNRCGNVADPASQACWCAKEFFPQGIFALVPAELMNKACICKSCLDRFKTKSTESS